MISLTCEIKKKKQIKKTKTHKYMKQTIGYQSEEYLGVRKIGEEH